MALSSSSIVRWPSLAVGWCKTQDGSTELCVALWGPCLSCDGLRICADVLASLLRAVRGNCFARISVCGWFWPLRVCVNDICVYRILYSRKLVTWVSLIPMAMHNAWVGREN